MRAREEQFKQFFDDPTTTMTSTAQPRSSRRNTEPIKPLGLGNRIPLLAFNSKKHSKCTKMPLRVPEESEKPEFEIEKFVTMTDEN